MDSLDAMLGGIDAGEAQAEEREAREAPEPTPDVIASLEAQLPVEATPERKAAAWAKLDGEVRGLRALPPSERRDPAAGAGVLAALEDARDAGVARAFNSATETLKVESVKDMRATMNDLKVSGGIRDPEAIGTPSTRNEATFLVAVFAGTAVPATVAGYVLPGDFAFFVPYLLGGVVLVVLAVGSTAPGLLQWGIDRVNLVNPDYKDRALKHEAGHFLLAYLLGVPVTSYSLAIGEVRTEMLAARIGRPVFQGRLDIASELAPLSVVAMAGVAAEAQAYEDVMGQTADLTDLQLLLNRASEPVSQNEQLLVTRWAVKQAAQLLRRHRKEHAALIEAMREGKDVSGCMQAIEAAFAEANR